MYNLKKNQKGFSLVELLIVVVILGILASIAVPKFLTTRDESQLRTCQTNMATINYASELYYFANSVKFDPTGNIIFPAGGSGGPANASALYTAVTSDTSFFPDGPPACPVDGSTYTFLVTGRTSCSTHGSM